MGFIASLAFIGLSAIMPHGGWPGGILFYATLFFFFPMNYMGIFILMAFWGPNYDEMSIMFLIMAVCINWIVILIPIYLMSLFLKPRKTKDC